MNTAEALTHYFAISGVDQARPRSDTPVLFSSLGHLI
jgi:hypothetical protein